MKKILAVLIFLYLSTLSILAQSKSNLLSKEEVLEDLDYLYKSLIEAHSQSAVTASQIQDYNFGEIVGEETGEYPSLYASVFRYKLPNSGIEVQVSKGYIVRVNGSTAERGVIPDIYIKDYLLDEEDEILEGLLKWLN